MKNQLKTFARKAFAAVAPTVAQAGQDSWVINEVHNRRRGGYFVEIGSHDGLELSNTYLLEKRYGWSGLCIEANPLTFKLLIGNRNVSCLNICVDRSAGQVDFHLDGMMGGIAETLDSREHVITNSNDVITIQTESLTTVLEGSGAPETIDYFSIDVEGAEERILVNFDFDHYKFLAITIERPTQVTEKILLENGYVKVGEIPGLDSFYIHESHVDQYLANVLAVGRKRRLLMRR